MLRFSALGPRTLDATTVDGTDRRIEHRRIGVARNGAPLSKKNELKPWQKSMWCIPPKHNAEFVFHMENVLEVYKRPYDSRFPVICMDELSKQLTIETQTPLKAKPGRRRPASFFMAARWVRPRRSIACA